MASEAGVLPVDPRKVRQKGRLQPGHMFLVDTEQGRIVPDEEIKQELAAAQPLRAVAGREPYPAWKICPMRPTCAQPDTGTLTQRQQAFGYTYEDQRTILAPMAIDGMQPLGSMGTDTPLAVLSDQNQLLYNYFKQLFAQVTNPPIDPIREEIVTSTTTLIGSEANLLEPTATSARMIRLDHPLLSNQELEKLRRIDQPGFKSATLSLLFPAAQGATAMEKALERLFAAADAAIIGRQQHPDPLRPRRRPDNAAIPALLAVSGLHHHLVKNGTRTRVSLVLESGEPREVHHFAVLLGYGVNAINPYLAFESLDDMILQGHAAGPRLQEGGQKLHQGLHQRGRQDHGQDGHLHRAELPRRPDLRSGRPAPVGHRQILHLDAVAHRRDRYRRDRPGADGAPRNAPIRSGSPPRPDTWTRAGVYQWRKDGEEHQYNPLTITSLQKAVRTDDYQEFKVFSSLINEQNTRVSTPCAGCSTSRRVSHRCRSKRSNRSKRS